MPRGDGRYCVTGRKSGLIHCFDELSELGEVFGANGF
jgi:hypothetical protein